MQRFFEGKKWVLAVAIVLVGAYARAQGTKDTLTLKPCQSHRDCFERQSYY